MNKMIAIMTGLALLAACGCQKESMQGGGAAKGTGFKIDVPNTPVELRQGEIRTVTIKLSRGDYFKQDVQLTVETPQGLSIEPTSVMVHASDPAAVPVRIMASQGTAIGNYAVRVTGQPQDGAPASASFTVKVVAPKGAMAPGTAPAP